MAFCHPLEYIFHPRSIAVVGASADRSKTGYAYVRNLQKQGFKGGIYPVNPSLAEVAGLKAYPSIRNVPQPLDHVISCIPAQFVPGLVGECLECGVKAVTLYTGRLAETGLSEMERLEREIVEIARRGNIRLIGPNCMGIYFPREGLSFRPNFPKEPGRVAFLTQSGGNAAEFVYRAGLRGVRFSKVVSYGNACDLNESDFLEYLAQDDETEIIAAYMEGVKDGRRFFNALKAASSAKPVILVKAGRTQAGRRMAASHTASLAGDDTIWDAAIRQASAIRVYSLEELADLVLTFLFFPRPKGRRAGVIGGGGGPSVFAADEYESVGLKLPPLPEDIRGELRRMVPEVWVMLGNPLDVSVTPAQGVLLRIIEMVAAHPSFDLVIVDPGMEWLLGHPDGLGEIRERVKATIKSHRKFQKPTAVVIRSADALESWRWRATMREVRRCWEAGLPVYPTVGRAARAIGAFIKYVEGREEAG